MKVLAIDPGSEKSAFIVWDVLGQEITAAGIYANTALIEALDDFGLEYVLIEEVKSYGNIFGDSMIQTIFWYGRFYQQLKNCFPTTPIQLVPRKTIVAEVCRNSKANDAALRVAVLEFFRSYLPKSSWGVGREPLIGSKDFKGPFYDIKKDLWSALGLVAFYLSSVESTHLSLEEFLE